MDSHLYLTMLLIGSGVLIFFVYAWFKSNILKRDQRVVPLMASSGESVDPQFSLNSSRNDESSEITVDNTHSNTATYSTDDSLLVLSVMAKDGDQPFVSYDLLQAIAAAGLKFGEMNIFHYIYPEDDCGIKLFSLVSAEEPGEFNLDEMGDFSCPGLMLFMDAERVPDPSYAFDIMLQKAEQLAEDLDGKLCAGPKTLWTPELKSVYQDRLAQYRLQ